ncbi:RNA-binding Raly-like protein isoform X3 [Paralichthys olivaceus]|uniref:RNA-binding Raly-like protein isoform X3 n=1 Tax=Paralichthys olivaceus TaxID=8255 RepID=UPI003752D160
MTHFRSDCHRDRQTGMNTEQRAGRSTSAKRGSSASNRVFDYQRVPSSVPVDPNPIKRPRPSSSSSSSSSTAALRMKSSRASGRTNNTLSPASSSSKAKLKMTELLAIKRELTVIKVQIDGLLDRVDKMDRQRMDCSECPQSREPSVSGSPHRGSVSSLERESPEPGEASEDEQLHYQHYYPHRIKQHQSDLEDDL